MIYKPVVEAFVGNEASLAVEAAEGLKLEQITAATE